MIPIRDENPTKSFPIVTVTFIVINIFVFLKFNFGKNAEEIQLIFLRYGITSKYLLGYGITASLTKLITHMFFHADLFHLGGNMLYLWIFGNNIEDKLGKFRFIIFYILCGFTAAFLQANMNPASSVPMIGASGAIAGVLGAYVMLFPKARVLVVFPVFIFLYFFWVPAILILSLWFLIQIVSGYVVSTFYKQSGGVAWFAHVGGFLMGIIAIYPMLFTKYIFSKKRR